jgi:hypothetical protein
VRESTSAAVGDNNARLAVGSEKETLNILIKSRFEEILMEDIFTLAVRKGAIHWLFYSARVINCDSYVRTAPRASPKVWLFSRRPAMFVRNGRLIPVTIQDPIREGATLMKQAILFVRMVL